jgi:acylphosphatase
MQAPAAHDRGVKTVASMALVCVRFCVHGRVQGVFFRASTRTQALQLGLSGHAKNLADGSVEVIVCGDVAAIEALHHWLHDGPPSARVDRLDHAEIADYVSDEFLTL